MVAEALVTAGHTISSVLCPFPKPVGRKKIVTACAVELWARERTIPVINVDKEFFQNKQNSDALPAVDLLVVTDFGYLIPGFLLKFPKHGALNIHPSLLPRWRGATPVPFTLLFGDKETGVSIIAMNEKFDMGDVVAQEKVMVLPDDNTPTLLNRCFEAGAHLLVASLESFVSGKLKPIPQPAEAPTPTTRKFTKEDGFVPVEALRKAMAGEDFKEIGIRLLDEHHLPHTAASIHNMVRALSPWPGVWTVNKDGKRVKVLETRIKNELLQIVSSQIESQTTLAVNINLF
jgi:methionyl-tRNA formyltransferase